MRGLQNKVGIIAGGATGIGAATALRLASEGMRVVIGDINADGANLVASQIKASGGQALGVRFDITDETSVQQLVRAAIDTFGGLDLMHANAFDASIYSRDTDAVEVDLEVFERTIDVNLKGHLICTRYAIPELLKRGGGAMVYTSSGLAFVGDAQHVSYGISKAGICSLMRHVATRWGKQGIRANAVAPGFVMTDSAMSVVPKDLTDSFLKMIPSTRHGEPNDIASIVTFLASDDGIWMNGQIVAVDGGITMR